MNVEIITKNDLNELKKELISEITDLLKDATPNKKWLKSADVRELLNISSGTLQNLRVNGTLPYTKMGKIIYYEYDDVIAILKKNKKTA